MVIVTRPSQDLPPNQAAAIASGASTSAAITRMARLDRRPGAPSPAVAGSATGLRPRLGSEAAEAALAPRIFVDRPLQRRLVEIRPVQRHEHEFAVGGLPHQEIR